MAKKIKSVFILSATLLVACTPDFYAEQLIDAERDAQDREQRQKDEKRWKRLEEKLGIKVPDDSSATRESLEIAFPLASFPRGTCGDPLPLDKSLYPVSYYPIFITDKGDNLRQVKSKFCADAYAKRDGNGDKVIQVASFYTEKASEFLLLMENNFGEARLGSVSVIRNPK